MIEYLKRCELRTMAGWFLGLCSVALVVVGRVQFIRLLFSDDQQSVFGPEGKIIEVALIDAVCLPLAIGLVFVSKALLNQYFPRIRTINSTLVAIALFQYGLAYGSVSLPVSSEVNRCEQISSSSFKGTTFFGGVGMQGAYIKGMVQALNDAGISNVHAASAANWSSGTMLTDGISALFKNTRDTAQTSFAEFCHAGTQFNLIGYSFGSLQAAQIAMDYVEQGGTIDHLVLIGAPIEQKFLDEVLDSNLIKSVIVVDLSEFGDPIHAGISAFELVFSAVVLAHQFDANPITPKTGHYYYAGADVISQQRRQNLSEFLFNNGLR